MNLADASKRGPNGSWQTLSVQDFFSKVNWDNVVVQKMPLPIVKAGERSVNPNMTVNDFFNAIPWESEAAIAVPSKIDMTSPAEEEANNLTLEDFFGSF
ncbi:MAG: hypothetical protein AAGD25_05195 [Cyanobacteria bacterium P01_F01_bin.150]